MFCLILTTNCIDTTGRHYRIARERVRGFVPRGDEVLAGSAAEALVDQVRRRRRSRLRWLGKVCDHAVKLTSLRRRRSLFCILILIRHCLAENGSTCCRTLPSRHTTASLNTRRGMHSCLGIVNARSTLQKSNCVLPDPLPSPATSTRCKSTPTLPSTRTICNTLSLSAALWAWLSSTGS